MPDQDQPGQAPGDSKPTDEPKPQDQPKPQDAPKPPESETDDEKWDEARAKATISKLREFEKTAKAQAKELEQLRKAQKEADDAKLSEQERLQNRVKELEAETAKHAEERRALLVRTAVEREARKLNLVDEEAAFKLLDLGAIEFDDGGTPKNVDKLLKKLAEAKPYLVGQSNGTTPITPTPRADNGREATAAEIERLRRMELQSARAAM